jgi:hypothetical protein
LQLTQRREGAESIANDPEGNMSRIQIGGQQHEFLAIEILGREQVEFPVTYFENNWLTCIIEVVSGGFRGAVQCSLLTNDLVRLREIAMNLQNWSERELGFGTLEDWLRIDFFLDERGRLELLGDLRDQAGGNRLRFVLKLDQTYLSPFIANLDRAIQQYPVIGSPQLP